MTVYNVVSGETISNLTITDHDQGYVFSGGIAISTSVIGGSSVRGVRNAVRAFRN